MVENVVLRWKVESRNGSEENRIDLCTERYLVIGDSMFKDREPFTVLAIASGYRIV